MSTAERRIRWYAFGPEDRARLADALHQVLPRHPWVKAAYLHGSAARGERLARDVDLGLVADPIPVDRGAELRVGAEVAELTRFPVELDVRILNGADPVLLNNVLRDRGLLYESDLEARTWFEAIAMARWLDFRPVWERMRGQVLKKWAHE